MKLKKIFVFVFLVFFLLLICFTIFAAIDIVRFQDGKEPVFIVKKDHLNDGGTTVYYGIGYQLIDWKKIDSTVISDVHNVVGREYHILFYHAIEEGPTVELVPEEE